MLAARRGSAIVAGAIATFAHHVVGISNVFSVADELPVVWQAIPSVVGTLWPGRPLVGYESGDDLDVALRSGFTELGPLRVWSRGL